MTAIGFFLLCVVALMLFFDKVLFGDETPAWYAAIGVLSVIGGALSVVAGIATVLWRVMP
jgi:hypothetical protein